MEDKTPPPTETTDGERPNWEALSKRLEDVMQSIKEAPAATPGFDSRLEMWKNFKQELEAIEGNVKQWCLSISSRFVLEGADAEGLSPEMLESLFFAGSGNTLFEVSRGILHAEPNTFFTTMLSERWAEEGKGTDPADPIVLQYEDSEMLPLIFLYLQRGPRILVEVPTLRRGTVRARLLDCATYFCITTLKDYLHYPPDQFELPAEDLAIKHRTDILRHLFAMDRTHPMLADPYLDLVDVLLDPAALRQQSNRWPNMERVLPAYSSPVNPPRSLPEFHKRLRGVTRHADLFVAEFDWANVVMAGGAVLTSLLSEHTPYYARQSADVDLFLWGLDADGALAKLHEIDAYLRGRSTCPEDVILVRTQHALSWVGPGIPKTQVILRLYKSPSEVLYGFDLDCVCVLYDGRSVWALPRAVRAIQQRCNLFDLGRVNITFNQRAMKYSTRGFSLVIPGFSLSRVDWAKPGRSHHLSGIVRRLIDRYGTEASQNMKIHPELSFLLQDGGRHHRSIGDQVQGLPISDRAKSVAQSLLRSTTTAHIPRRRWRYSYSSRGGAQSDYQIGVLHALCMYDAPETTRVPVPPALPEEQGGAGSSSSGPGASLVTPPIAGLKPDSGYDDCAATTMRSTFCMWIACVAAQSTIKFLGATTLDAALEGRVDPALIDLMALRLGTHALRLRTGPGFNTPFTEEEDTKAMFARRYESLVELAGRPLEWIRIDLDRSFVGTFHHVIAAEYFDCYKSDA